MKNNSYWKARQAKMEQRSQSIANRLVRLEKREYERLYKRLHKEIYDLYSRANTGGKITRTDLWNAGKTFQLQEMIREEFNILATKQDALMYEMLKVVYEDTLKTEMKHFDENFEFNDTHKLTMETKLKEVYKGSNYSSRIYKNANTIASRISQDMSRLITSGTSPDTLMKQLQNDFNMGYNQSSRLVRTEASRVYNSAAEQGFKIAGVEKVEYDADHESCEVCGQNQGKIFEIDQAPKLPAHPNCRCFYIPIVEID